MNTLPRIKGRVGQVEDGEQRGKWFFELSIWDLYGKEQQGEPFIIGPWETEEIAGEELKKASRIVCDAFVKEVLKVEPSGEYMDMKNGGVLRPWDNHS